MSNTEKSVQDSNGQPLTQERVEAVAAELKIPKNEAARMLDAPEDYWF